MHLTVCVMRLLTKAIDIAGSFLLYVWHCSQINLWPVGPRWLVLTARPWALT